MMCEEEDTEFEIDILEDSFLDICICDTLDTMYEGIYEFIVRMIHLDESLPIRDMFEGRGSHSIR